MLASFMNRVWDTLVPDPHLAEYRKLIEAEAKRINAKAALMVAKAEALKAEARAKTAVADAEAQVVQQRYDAEVKAQAQKAGRKRLIATLNYGFTRSREGVDRRVVAVLKLTETQAGVREATLSTVVREPNSMVDEGGATPNTMTWLMNRPTWAMVIQPWLDGTLSNADLYAYIDGADYTEVHETWLKPVKTPKEKEKVK